MIMVGREQIFRKTLWVEFDLIAKNYHLIILQALFQKIFTASPDSGWVPGPLNQLFWPVPGDRDHGRYLYMGPPGINRPRQKEETEER